MFLHKIDKSCSGIYVSFSIQLLFNELGKLFSFKITITRKITVRERIPFNLLGFIASFATNTKEPIYMSSFIKLWFSCSLKYINDLYYFYGLVIQFQDTSLGVAAPFDVFKIYINDFIVNNFFSYDKL